MERYDVYWKKLDTHEPHLSVLNYKKQERVKEVEALEVEIDSIHTDIKYYSLNSDEYDTDQETVNKSAYEELPKIPEKPEIEIPEEPEFKPIVKKGEDLGNIDANEL